MKRTGTSVYGHGRCLRRIFGVTMAGFNLFNGTFVTDDVTIEAPLTAQHVLEYVFVCTRWDSIYTKKILNFMLSFADLIFNFSHKFLLILEY